MSASTQHNIISSKLDDIEYISCNTSENISASIIWLHGLGADCYDFTNMIPLLNLDPKSGIRFIFPNAPWRQVTIDPNAGTRIRAWYDIYDLENLNQEDETGIIESEKIVQKLIQHEVNEKGINSNRIILAGFSQGGAMALFTGLRYSNKIAGILALSCYLPLTSEISNANESPNSNTPILLMHGKNDPIIPVAAATQTHQFLSQMEYNSNLKLDSYEHELPAKQTMEISEWIKEILC